MLNGRITCNRRTPSGVSDQSTLLSGRRHEYDYDGIGNRKWSNASGISSLRDNYTVNELNQYTARENNTIAVGGTADIDAMVAVRSTGLAGRAGRHWGDSITLENFWRPFYGPLRVYAVKPGTGGSSYAKQTIERAAFLPKASQSFTYDLDGNLTNDGVWTYQWDGESRLTAMQTTSEAILGGVPAQRIEFKYDYLHRRVEKLVRGGWNGTTFMTVTSQRRYLYDGWSLVAEFSVSGSTLTLIRSYTWGLDIARSLADAGGVGALLQIRDHTLGKDYFPSYDGNGNIAALFDADNGTVVAAYEYSPYGEFLRCEGAYSKENPFRFSTKFADDETGLVYYGRRYYSPSQGRFLGRDPKEEQGGLMLYGFVVNNPANSWDYLGMEPGFDPSYHDQIAVVEENGSSVKYRAVDLNHGTEGLPDLIWQLDSPVVLPKFEVKDTPLLDPPPITVPGLTPTDSFSTEMTINVNVNYPPKNSECETLRDNMSRTSQTIKDAINSFSDLSTFFSDARRNAWVSLGQNAGFAGFGLTGAFKSLTANAARTAPALVGGSGGYVRSAPTGIWTSSGRIATIGTPDFTAVAQAATNARNVGAMIQGAQAVGPDIAQFIAANSSNIAQRILDPAGNLAETQIRVGNALSQQTGVTILQMQNTFKAMQDKYNKNCR